MIQRSQSLWLLFAAILAFLTLNVSFFSGNIIVANVKQFQKFTAMSSMFLMILTVVVGAACLVNIFLYKNRKLQLKISIAVFVLSLLNLLLYFFATKDFIPTDWSFNLTGVAAFAIPFFLILAVRGIYKDEKLVKSADRLR